MAVTGRLVFNDSSLLVQSALDGLGIAYMINGTIEPLLQEGRLIRLLQDWSPPLAGFSLYFPDRQRLPRKLRALIDFLRSDEAAQLPDATDQNRPLMKIGSSDGTDVGRSGMGH